MGVEKDCDCRKDQTNQLIELAQQVEDEVDVAQLAQNPARLMREMDSDPKVQSIGGGIASSELNAVQRLYCGDGGATAFLACDGKTIVTNAHAIMTSSGQPKWAENSGESEKSCDFFVENRDGTFSSFEVEKPSRKELIDNKNIGSPNILIDPNQIGNDWAVLKLKTSVPADIAKPLKIGRASNMNQLKGLPMVLASARVEALSTNAGQVPPRGYSVCTGTNHKFVNQLRLLETNCTAGNARGFSGSPMISPQGGKPLAVAIHSFAADSKGTVGPRSIPIEKDFLNSIEKISGVKDCVVPLEGESRSASL